MMKKIIKKILPKKLFDQIKKVIKPNKVNYYKVSDIDKRAEQFNLKTISILTDGQTDLSPLFFEQKNFEIVGIYSFNLDCIGTIEHGHEIKPLLPSKPVETDGWIVSSINESATFALNRFLLDCKRESQVILQHYISPNGVRYYSYVDFFNNNQRSIIQINNYFRRLYALAFPVDLRLTLRDLNGKILKATQTILRPDSIKVIKSEEFIKDKVDGYIEVEFEMTKKVTPFLHYMADYIAPDFISSNHQSGLGLHPAGSEFTRGYIPTEKEKSLQVCLFQHNYDTPIDVKAILHYFENGEEKIIEKTFPPLHKKQMLYTDIKELFNEIDFSKVVSPFVVTKADVPLHRPNYYYVEKGKPGYYDTSHAGPDLKNHIKNAYGGVAEVTDLEKEKMKKLDVVEMDLRHHIFPKNFGIESIISIGGNDSTCKINDFKIDLYDLSGKLVKSFEDKMNFENERYLNLNEYLSKKNFSDFSGTISFRPNRNTISIPININSITGYRYKKNYITSTAGNGGNPDNIPFYFRGGPPNYFKFGNSANNTDIFARGISSDEFDTIYTISYATANSSLKKPIKYEIQIVNIDGEKKVVYKTLEPNGCDIIKLSELVQDTGHKSEGGFYTVWLFSGEGHLYAQHILLRKSDGALALEHCYAGRFGI